MGLIKTTLDNELSELHEENVVINFIGDISKLSPVLQETMSNSVEKTKNNTGVKLNIAINYGGRAEIVNAVKNIVRQGINEEDITEELITKELYTASAPMPDLLIRTGGEMRISNYLLWQIAYSEFYVTDKYWPEFGEEELSKALTEYNSRQRRFGK